MGKEILISSLFSVSIPVQQLRNLGPRSAGWLAQINILTADDLRSIGAAAAYRELIIQGIVKPHRMLLYALGGALDDVDCLRMDRARKREFEDEAGITHSQGA